MELDSPKLHYCQEFSAPETYCRIRGPVQHMAPAPLPWPAPCLRDSMWSACHAWRGVVGPREHISTGVPASSVLMARLGLARARRPRRYLGGGCAAAADRRSLRRKALHSFPAAFRERLLAPFRVRAPAQPAFDSGRRGAWPSNDGRWSSTPAAHRDEFFLKARAISSHA